ncbi:MAG: OprD family outer membrane porin [Sulfurimonadaceae bacterium]|jgi:hypothetical protein|nr:OprD family outer membrane porin [Sulfurimonadaceae bacterium]
MKIKILQILSVTMMLSITTQAAEITNEAKISGQIRSFSIARSLDFSQKDDYTRSANAIGGFLKYETADFYGFHLGGAFYTTNGFALKSDKANNPKVDPTLLGVDNKSYTILGEAYLEYKYKNTELKLGRQKLNTPLAGADDGRMLPNLFHAYTLTNTDIEDTKIFISHATHFAQGTFGRIYSAQAGQIGAQILSATAAYSAVDSKNQVGEFVNIGTYALGTKTDGLSIASLTYSGVKGLKLQAWDYYAHDILNAIYLQADYKLDMSETIKPFVAMQYIKENDAGKRLLKNMGGDGKLDSDYFAIKLGVDIENFNTYIAHSRVSANDVTDPVYANATITMWGGMPAFIQGMLTRLAGTKASKVHTAYNFEQVLVTASYAKFIMDKNNGWTYGNASEIDLSATYKPSFVKNLELKARATYANDFLVMNANGGTLSWDEYHFIVKYNF